MTIPELPETPTAFATSSWAEIAPLYRALEEHPLDTPAEIERWLLAWSRLDELVAEAAALAMVAYTADTRDAGRAADTAAATGFYDAYGFTTISRRAGYYRGGVDALVMQLELQEA